MINLVSPIRILVFSWNLEPQVDRSCWVLACDFVWRLNIENISLYIHIYIYIQVHVYTVYRIPFFGISLPADSCWFSRKAHGNWSCNDVFLSSSWSYRWRNRSMSTWMPWNGLLGLGPSWPRPGGHRHSRHGCYWSYHDLQRDRIRLFLTSWLPAGPWNTKSSWMAASFNDRLHKQLRIGPIRCTSWTCLAGCLAQRARFTIYIYIVTFISGYDIGYMYQCLASDAYIYIYACILMMNPFSTFIALGVLGTHFDAPRYPFRSLKFPESIHQQNMSQSDQTRSMKGDLIANSFSPNRLDDSMKCSYRRRSRDKHYIQNFYCWKPVFEQFQCYEVYTSQFID